MFSLSIFTILVTPAQAENEFASSYNITYDVDSSGITTVTEKITLRNLTDRFYASSFNLSIGATNITDVAATDSQGPLESEVQNQGKKTGITVKFNQQVAGLNKTYLFTIQFRSKDFAQAQGKIWQVSVPKISSPGNLDKYDLTLSVPVSFGDPTSILPEPVKQSESNGKINFLFNKEQLTDAGILANFGDNQLMDFTLYYYLENNGLLPTYEEVVLPSDSAYQKIFISNVFPRPENTYYDGDGNTTAVFKVDKGQKINVEVAGSAVLSFNVGQKKTLTEDQKKSYLAAQRYWDKDNPQITAKLNEILSGAKKNSTQEKAKLIYKYVVSTLSYDQERLKANDFQRLGALTILNNPTKALCLEFVDLFVTLMRAAGIPARELIGYAFTTNTDIRPLSLRKDILHAWAEYYDPNSGWVMVDPTWENTTGGVDYFTKFDLNHLVLAIRGLNSEKPNPPGDVRVQFRGEEATPSGEVNLQLLTPAEIFAGFPSKLKVRIENRANIATGSAQFLIKAGKLGLSSSIKDVENSFLTAGIPPFGNLEYEFTVKSQSPLEGLEDTIEASWGNKTISKKVMVKPFFAFSPFSYGVMGVVFIIILLYLATVVFHLKFHSQLQGTAKKNWNKNLNSAQRWHVHRLLSAA